MYHLFVMEETCSIYPSLLSHPYHSCALNCLHFRSLSLSAPPPSLFSDHKLSFLGLSQVRGRGWKIRQGRWVGREMASECWSVILHVVFYILMMFLLGEEALTC